VTTTTSQLELQLGAACKANNLALLLHDLCPNTIA
jgi:hypothetical protein